MTRATKRYLVWLFSLTVCGLAAYAALCVILDPYRVFSPQGLVTRNFEANTRAVKARRLDELCGSIAVFAFGNSRSYLFAGPRLERLAGGEGFNYGVSAETLGGMLHRLEAVASRCPAQRVFLFIDITMFQLAGGPATDLLRREPGSLSGHSRLEFLWPYFFLPVPTVLRAIDGMRRPLADPHKPIPRQCYAPKPWNERVYADNLARFRQVVDFASKRVPNATFVAVPMNQNMLANVPIEALSRWARDVAAATDGIWFFGGMNEFAVDDRRYVDIGHFDDSVADRIVDVVVGARRGGELTRFYRADESEQLASAVTLAGRAWIRSCGARVASQ